MAAATAPPSTAKLEPAAGIWMGCAKCGGRMLTKVGRRQPMLICSDCGHPRNEADQTTRNRHRLSGSLFLVGLTAVSAMTLFLSHISEKTRPGPDPAELSGEGSATAGE